MKKAIILHGRPSKKQFDDPNFPSTSNYYWLPWLQKQLALNGVPSQTPEVPHAWRPHYPTWKETFEQFHVDKETILVGHSCGGGFLVRWLSEHKVTVGKVILVAPWIDAEGDPDNEDTKDFMNFMIDPGFADRAAEIVIVNSDNDKATIQRSVQRLQKEVTGIKYVELHDRGHFYDDNAMEFPELLEEILK